MANLTFNGKRLLFYGSGSIGRVLNFIPSLLINDWFLPSLDELSDMYVELHDGFGLGDFTPKEYWSSSEQSATGVNTIDFADGQNWVGVKQNPNTSVRACRTFTAGIGDYSIRDIGPAGGYIFHISGTTYYEAAPSDQSQGHTWSNITLTAVTGTGTAIGTGASNTIKIIDQPLHTDSAAKICDDYSIVV
jgi:hypothetical protein